MEFIAVLFEAIFWVLELFGILLYILMIPLAVFFGTAIPLVAYLIIELIFWLLKRINIVKKRDGIFALTNDVERDSIISYEASHVLLWIISASILLYGGLLQSFFWDWINYLSEHLGFV